LIYFYKRHKMSNCAVKSLVCWEDPVTSAVVFLPVTVILVSLSVWSLLYVVAMTFLLSLLSVASLKGLDFVYTKLGKPNPLGTPLQPLMEADLSIDPEKTSAMLTSVVESVNSATSELKKILLLEDVLKTAKFGAVCYTLSVLGASVNLLTLVLLAWVLVFSLPKLYVNNQVAADQVLEKLKLQVDSVKEKVFKSEPKQD